ncbi:MAG: hypothetical protein ABI963_09230, partial [Rhizomicrobium sp.]
RPPRLACWRGGASSRKSETPLAGNSYGWRLDGGVGGGGELSLYKFSNVRGTLFNPAYSSQTASTLDESICTSIFHFGDVTEQALFYDCVVGSATDCYAVAGAWMLHIKNCDAYLNVGDVFPITAPQASNASVYTGAGLGVDSYEWIEETTARTNSNVASGLHPDWRQQRTGTAGGGTTYVLHKNNYANKGSVNASGSIYQESDSANIQGAVLNNIFAAMGPRGTDIG